MIGGLKLFDLIGKFCGMVSLILIIWLNCIVFRINMVGVKLVLKCILSGDNLSIVSI